MNLSYLQQHWNADWSEFSCVPPFDLILKQYETPPRQYHTLAHIEQCLREWDAVKDQQQLLWDGLHVVFAIWFHDAVYDAQSKTNEEDSVTFFRKVATEYTSVGPDLLQQVERLILVTKSHTPQALDEELMVDIDLSILGQPKDKFDSYDQAIRWEYSHVADFFYYPARKKIMKTFFARNPLFRTPTLRDKYEAQAKINLKGIIDG